MLPITILFTAIITYSFHDVSDCEAEEYECYSGKCIPRQYVCNTVNDCGDLSDEQGCGCALDQFTCKASQTCIPVQYKCNGYDDCPDSSDEDIEMCKGKIDVSTISYNILRDNLVTVCIQT